MDILNSSQTGSVRKKGKQWYYRFRIQDSEGNWKLHEFKGGKTKAETQLLLNQAIIDYKDHNAIFNAGSITISELCYLWYESEIENSNLTTNGKKNYKNTVKNIATSNLGKLQLKNVTCEDIQNYVDTLYFGKYDDNGKLIQKAYATSTMRKFFLVLNNIFKYAVYPKHFLRENLMQYVKKRNKKYLYLEMNNHQKFQLLQMMNI